VEDANHENRGELVLRHSHQGMDLKMDYAKEVLRSLARVWKRPVNLVTLQDGKSSMMRFDGADHAQKTS
jgi:stage V sporulation protein R